MDLFPKENAPDFSKSKERDAFAKDTSTKKELLQKELNTNQEEQVLLSKRIRAMREFLNEISSDDPQYAMLAAQIQMDQIELDELKNREEILVEKISAN
ncbi:MAG: hypothetical protein A3E80_01910 [Chlamydiae bacterium RIFCSPHIGHO2_12_FULL_49_9]|nr:MAG: hypothetical protein A3E80_01910 [Chlamydiae bacterium RIFCSPHIGHO2_12_FULL_49_9]